MVFNSDSEPEECPLLDMSFVTMAIVDCELLLANVMSLVNFVLDGVPIVDPNRAGPSLTLPNASLDASVVHAKSNTIVEPLSIVVAEPSNAGNHKKGCQFIPLNQELFEKVCSMVDGKSIKNERWATDRFNSWRESVGLGSEVALVDLPLEKFADLLTCFFLGLCKDSSEQYLSRSIDNMYDSFHKIIAKHQCKVMKRENRKEPLIQICDHHFFSRQMLLLKWQCSYDVMLE